LSRTPIWERYPVIAYPFQIFDFFFEFISYFEINI
jgi:hypothetical protein